MRNKALLILGTLLSFSLLQSCQERQLTWQEKKLEIYDIYQRIIEEEGQYYPDDPEESTWTYTYHPLIYAAWVFKGSEKTNAALELKLNSGNSTFWSLRDNLLQQIETGKGFEREVFLGLISDDDLRSATSDYMENGVSPVYAYARAFMASVLPEHPNAPSQILAILGKVYKYRPDLLEVPVGDEQLDDDKMWRDWLHHALAACGKRGVTTVLEFDDQLEKLQDLVPGEDFWAGRLSVAYNLRSLQLAGSEALEPLLELVASYRDGGEINGFESWIYYTLAWSTQDPTVMFPCDREKLDYIHKFLYSGLLEGPMGDNSEAVTIAESYGRVPSYEVVKMFEDFTGNSDIDCERRALGYHTLEIIYLQPVDEWESNPEKQVELKNIAISVLERGGLECGNLPVLYLYSAVVNGFEKEWDKDEGVVLTDADLMDIHKAFIDLLPELKTADERATAIDLMQWDLLQLDFVVRNPEISYRDELKAVRESWEGTTNFTDSDVTRENFEKYMLLFDEIIGPDNLWTDE